MMGEAAFWKPSCAGCATKVHRSSGLYFSTDRAM